MGRLTDHLKVNMAGNPGLDGEPRGEIPTAEVQSRADNQVRNLRYGLRGNERKPMIGLGLDMDKSASQKAYERGSLLLLPSSPSSRTNRGCARRRVASG